MKLGQAIDYHSKVPMAGWSPTTGWVEGVVRGDFLAFDRFITERSFGQKKRLFQTNSQGPVPEQYTGLRTPSGRQYLIAAHNEDFDQTEIYNNVYMLQEASYSVEIMELQLTGVPASGIGGTATPTPIATVIGDMERQSSVSSTEFDTVTYSTNIITLPQNTVVNSDHELRINTIMYDVLEVWETMKTVVVRANRRSAGV